MSQNRVGGNKAESAENRKVRPFPKNTLKEAIGISQTIQDQNNGKPMKRIFVADSMSIKPESSNFKYLISASNKYGLTQGNEKSEYISLTTLGEAIVKAKDTEKAPLLQEALQKISVFQNFYQRYRDARLPADDYARKLLRDEFGVPEEHTAECYDLILSNGSFAGLIKDVAGAKRVVFDSIPPISLEEPNEEQVTIEEGASPQDEAPEAILPEPSVSKPKQIFIAHGKNTTPLEQLKKILEKFGKVPYKVAIDEPYRGRPISQKVADTMNSCTSAIFIFTADEEVTDCNGIITFRPSDNIVYELGAAGVLYGKNIVIFKEEGLTFASDFSDLGYITFEKNKLDAKATELLTELIGFGLLKITPA